MANQESGQVAPLVSLEDFREEVGYNPWHFWGLSGTLAPVDSACNTPVAEYAWQGVDAAGRSEIRTALMTAEERLRELLGYSIAPRFTERTVLWPELANSYLKRWGYMAGDRNWATVQLPNDGAVIAAGVEELTLVAANVAVTLVDADSDGLTDTFTLPATATTATDPGEIAVYFSANERFDGSGVSERWRIQPVSVSISGGNVTIRGRSVTIVDPIRYQGFRQPVLDAALAVNYAATLDIYQRTVDVAGQTSDDVQAILTWVTAPSCCSGWGASADPAGSATALARVALRDPLHGVLGIGEAVYNTTLGQWVAGSCLQPCSPPDSVTIRYYAGDSLDNSYRVKKRWRTIVSRLACAEMMRKISSCDVANREIYQWQLDMSRAGGREMEQFSIAQSDLSNPLGTLKGQVYAWKAIQHERQLQGVLA